MGRMKGDKVMRYVVVAPRVPGGQNEVIGQRLGIVPARKLAKEFEKRKDLGHHDVRIERAYSYQFVEFAGPKSSLPSPPCPPAGGIQITRKVPWKI